MFIISLFSALYATPFLWLTLFLNLSPYSNETLTLEQRALFYTQLQPPKHTIVTNREQQLRIYFDGKDALTSKCRHNNSGFIYVSCLVHSATVNPELKLDDL